MNEPKAALERGLLLYEQEKFESALPELEKGLPASDKPAEVHFRLGFCHRILGNSDRAKKHFEIATEVAPNKDVFHRELGRQIAQNGDRRTAIAHFARSIELNPMDALSYHESGACLASLSYFELALVCLTVCSVLWGFAVPGLETYVSENLLKMSMKHLHTTLPAKDFLEIQASVFAVIGMRRHPDGSILLPENGFQVIADKTVPQLREIAN